MTEYHVDDEYLSTLKRLLETGTPREDRTGTGTKSIFGVQNRYDLTKGFPLLTTKRVYPRGVFGELIFFLQGNTSNNWLRDQKITIWDEWADERTGDLGPIYGYQWRHFGANYVSQIARDAGVIVEDGVDQIMGVLKALKTDPFSRRHIVSAWNPVQLNDMALPPCHTMFQFHVTPDENGQPMGLSCQLYQRSADWFLGVPFNVASYSALTHLFADLIGLKPLEFVHTVGDAHLYSNHEDQARLQLERLSEKREMPTLTIEHPTTIDDNTINNRKLFDDYTVDSFKVDGYDPHPGISAPVAV